MRGLGDDHGAAEPGQHRFHDLLRERDGDERVALPDEDERRAADVSQAGPEIQQARLFAVKMDVDLYRPRAASLLKDSRVSGRPGSAPTVAALVGNDDLGYLREVRAERVPELRAVEARPAVRGADDRRPSAQLAFVDLQTRPDDLEVEPDVAGLDSHGATDSSRDDVPVRVAAPRGAGSPTAAIPALGLEIGQVVLLERDAALPESRDDRVEGHRRDGRPPCCRLWPTPTLS